MSKSIFLATNSLVLSNFSFANCRNSNHLSLNVKNFHFGVLVVWKHDMDLLSKVSEKGKTS